MKRGSELKRTTPLRNKAWGIPRRKGKREKPRNGVSRPTDTGPTLTVRTRVRERDGGCLRCGAWRHPDGMNIHHRCPRRMGGTSDPAVNSPANLVLLCGSATSAVGCHSWVESNRTDAIAAGWLLSTPSAATAVAVASYRGPLFLTADGQALTTDPSTDRENP